LVENDLVIDTIVDLALKQNVPYVKSTIGNGKRICSVSQHPGGKRMAVFVDEIGDGMGKP